MILMIRMLRRHGVSSRVFIVLAFVQIVFKFILKLIRKLIVILYLNSNTNEGLKNAS